MGDLIVEYDKVHMIQRESSGKLSANNLVVMVA